MRNSVTSNNTKTMLVNALKELLEDTPLENISITDVVNKCGVNRKTFYYHFKDIHALVKWMLDQEVLGIIRQIDYETDPEDAIAVIIDFVADNMYLANCVYDSLGRELMRQFFYNDCIDMVSNVVKYRIEKAELVVSERAVCFISRAMTEDFVGILINWMKGDLDLTKYQLAMYVTTIGKPVLAAALNAAAKEKLL